MQPPPWNNRGPYDSLGDPQLGSSTSFRQKRTLCAHTGKVGSLSPCPLASRGRYPASCW